MEDKTMTPNIYIVSASGRNRAPVAVSVEQLPGGCTLYNIIEWNAAQVKPQLSLEAPK